MRRTLVPFAGLLSINLAISAIAAAHRLLLTGGGEEADNGELVIRGFQQLVAWVKGRMAGHWFVGGCTQPDAIGEETRTAAVEFARRLCGGAG